MIRGPSSSKIRTDVSAFPASDAVRSSLLTTPVAVAIASVTITNSRRRVLLNITPNSFPATRYNAKRDTGDDRPIEYVQVQIELR